MIFKMHLDECDCACVNVRKMSDSIINLSVLYFRTQQSCDDVTGDNVAGGQRAKALRSCV